MHKNTFYDCIKVVVNLFYSCENNLLTNKFYMQVDNNNEKCACAFRFLTKYRRHSSKVTTTRMLPICRTNGQEIVR